MRGVPQQINDGIPLDGRIDLLASEAKHRDAFAVAPQQLILGSHIHHAQGQAAEFWHTQQQLQCLLA